MLQNAEGCTDLQLKENFELCRSMLRLTDDQRAMRAQIAELEDTVTSLTQQLLQAQAVSWFTESEKNYLGTMEEEKDFIRSLGEERINVHKGWEACCKEIQTY